jgi:hypothetical protein
MLWQSKLKHSHVSTAAQGEFSHLKKEWRLTRQNVIATQKQDHALRVSILNLIKIAMEWNASQACSMNMLLLNVMPMKVLILAKS